MSEKVSVIVPVYNTNEKYLIKCITSIKNQTYKNLEIVIIDDGSEKETAELCDKLAKDDSRIVVVHKANEGVSEARNTGLSLVSGNWVTFVDSDDWIEVNMIDVLIKKTENCDLVIARNFIDNEKMIIANEDIEVVHNENYELINNLLLDKPKIKTLGAVWGKLYSKKVINNIYFSKKVKMGEDYLYNFDVFLNVNTAKYIPNYLYHYRNDNNDSVTRKYDKKLLEKYEMLFEEFENKMNKQENLIFRKVYNVFIIRQLDYFCVLNLYNKNNELSAKERVEILKVVSNIEVYKKAIKNVKLQLLLRKKVILVVFLRMRLYSALDWILYKKRR